MAALGRLSLRGAKDGRHGNPDPLAGGPCTTGHYDAWVDSSFLLAMTAFRGIAFSGALKLRDCDPEAEEAWGGVVERLYIADGYGLDIAGALY